MAVAGSKDNGCRTRFPGTMHIWIALAARETALLTLLLLAGSGPASFLSDRFDAASRIAMAPLLGFCVATCVTTTLIQFAPTNDTFWILILIAAISAVVAIMRTGRARGRSPWRQRLPFRDLAGLLLVALAIAGPLTYTLHHHDTVGPAAYTYTDADNYIAMQDGARTVSLHTARATYHRLGQSATQFTNLGQFVWSSLANLGSNLDATPLDSNVNALLGLGATDTFSPFLIVWLLVGGLGLFAAVRYYTRSRTVMAVLAGALFGGAFFLELWFDTYQAAIIAIGLVVPFMALVDDALRVPRAANAVLIALLLATMGTVYPLYVPLLVAGAALMLVWQALKLRADGGEVGRWLRPVALTILAIAVMAIVFDPVSFTRDIRYYHGVLNGTVGLARVGYQLPISVLPGWIAQTREFWFMPPLGSADFKQILLGGIVPLVLAGFALLALWRRRPTIALVGLGAVCSIVAEYAYASRQACTYCAERDLLPLAPIAAVLVTIGLWALFALPHRWAKAAAILGAALVVVTVGQRARVELTRFSDGSYFLDSADRSLLSELPRGGGSIEEEGFEASLYPQAEQTLVYHLISERYPDHASIILGTEVGNATSYLDFGPVIMPPGPQFNPNYRYVLTRFASIATDRRLIASSHGLALEERLAPLDVTPFAGLEAPLVRLSPSGTAWVDPQYPLQLLVAGYDGDRPAWARLTFRTTVPVRIFHQPGVRARKVGHVLTACVQATGAQPARIATLRLAAHVFPATPPNEKFPPVMPLEGLALTGMRAVTGSCSL